VGVSPYDWANVDEFVNRAAELARMEAWWSSASRQPLAVLGRRRVGKSWLFRRFAHHKPAVVLVAERLPVVTQLARFAEVLEPVIGVRPKLDGIGDLIRALYRAAASEQLLVVIDEFPYLLGASASEVAESSSAVQAAMETERDTSLLKLVVCGSQVSQMEAMFGEQNPLHGRLERLEVRLLTYTESAGLLKGIVDPIERFERYCVTGGMPMYLSRLGTGSLRDAVCTNVLDRFAPLWNEGRSLVEQELREPRVYLAILERLASGNQEVHELAQHAGIDSPRASKYLSVLSGLRLVSRSAPIGSGPDSRDGRWQLDDPFLRFWFRFVFVHQGDLEGGLDAGGLFDALVAPDVADHCAPVFEQWGLAWLRAHHASTAVSWGRWWGNAANVYRRDKTRSTDEVDAVGLLRNRVTAVAECKWTNKQLTPSIVTDLDTYKIPAMRDAGLKVVKEPRIILMCRSGYSASLVRLATTDERIELVDVRSELSTS
jgi:uncharacterized protein